MAVLLRPVPAGGLRGPRPGGGARVASTASAGALVVLLLLQLAAPTALGAVAPGLAVGGLLLGLPHGAVNHVVPFWSTGEPVTLARLARVLVSYVAVAAAAAAALLLVPAPAVAVFLVELAVLVACFTVVPPLAAFGVYFGLWHAGRHTWRMVELAAGADARPVGHGRALRRYALHAAAPTAVALAALLAIAATRDASVLATEIAVLLALTFPHVQTVAVLDAAGARRGRDSTRQGAPTLRR